MKHEEHHHRRNKHPHKPCADLSHFYVIAVISNPEMFKKRYQLYWRFAEMVRNAGVKLITVEQAFGDRPFMVTQSCDQFDVQVRSSEVLWLKERMINLGIHRMMDIDPLAREVTWCDADTFPMIPAVEWFEMIWHGLQNYEFLQPWQYLQNFGANGEPVGKPDMSFVATYAAAGYQVPKSKSVAHTLAGNSGMTSLGRTGLVWSANVSALNKVGLLLDRCILGSSDWHQAHALVGALEQFSGEFLKLSRYAQYLLDFQDKCEKWIKRDVGFIPVTVGHWHHGSKENRFYGSRGKILIDNQYDPYVDIKLDAQGLYQLETFEPRQIRMRDQIRAYFSSRREDD